MRIKDCGPKTEAKDHGVIQTVSQAASILVNDHSIVFGMEFFDSP